MNIIEMVDELLTRKKYRLTIDFHIDVRKLNERMLNDHLKGFSNYEELKDSSLNDYSHNTLLQNELIKNEEILKIYLQKRITTIIEEFIGELNRKEVESDINDFELLKPLIDKLPEKEKEILYEAEENDAFAEATELLYIYGITDDVDSYKFEEIKS
jgi:formate dehydrogenase maturation protein FdhE